MSHEALHKTKLEYEKQKKDMKDVDLEISRLEKLRDKEQKSLDSKKTEKIELEAKITRNIQEQKKDLPQDQKDALVAEKTNLDNRLAVVNRDIPIFTSIVQDYNQKIERAKKGKDVITPKLASAKNESVGERIAHFTKKNWKALLASTILLGTAATAYEYGKNSSGDNKKENEKHAPVTPPKDNGKDTTAHWRDGSGKKDNVATTTRRRKENHSEERREEKGGSPKVVYKITNPDGTKEKFFDSKEERDAFVKSHNEVLHENVATTSTKGSENVKVEYKLVSPDGKQTKIFNTREERNAFAKEHNLQIKED